jgi:predicted DNA-binding transcriptional regulator YafY
MLLDSRGTVKASQLAKILEASERTIYRDIDLLCESGIPITSTYGPSGGYSFMEGYKLNTSSLGSHDIFTLLLSSMGVQPEKDTLASLELKNALTKLENSVPEEHRLEIIRAREKFFIDSDPWWGTKPPNKHLDTLKKAILDLRKLKICYKKYTGDCSERIVRPYGVVVKNTECYLIAYCEEKEQPRVFKCTRIQSIETLDEFFVIPPDFSLETFWEDSKQHFIKNAIQTDSPCAYKVKVHSTYEITDSLKGFDILSSLQMNDLWVYEMDLLSFKTALNILFPLSDQLEVVQPLALRDSILSKAKKVLALYIKN